MDPDVVGSLAQFHLCRWRGRKTFTCLKATRSRVEISNEIQTLVISCLPLAGAVSIARGVLQISGLAHVHTQPPTPGVVTTQCFHSIFNDCVRSKVCQVKKKSLAQGRLWGIAFVTFPVSSKLLNVAQHGKIDAESLFSPDG